MPDLQLDSGETATIVLAAQRHADLLLIDERDGRAVASAQFALKVAGTLGLLRDAAVAGRVELATAFDRLRQTSFRASPALYDQVLHEVTEERSRG